MKISISILLVILLIGGCVTPPLNHQQIKQGPLKFLADGATTREQIMLKFGEPTGTFESGRILTYRLDLTPQNDLQVVGRQKLGESGMQSQARVDYSLVLVFDGPVLARHSLVSVK